LSFEHAAVPPTLNRTTFFVNHFFGQPTEKHQESVEFETFHVYLGKTSIECRVNSMDRCQDPEHLSFGSVGKLVYCDVEPEEAWKWFQMMQGR
jgi:hypothetical protein